MKLYKHVEENLLLEMAEIGRFEGFRLLIYGCEGPIPHFHIENKEKNIYSCIKILEDDYFRHGKYKDKLSSKDVKKLKQFLLAQHKLFGKHGYTNWQIICIYWNDNNPDYQIEDVEKVTMPSYNNI